MWDLSCTSLKGLLQGVKGHLRSPFDCYSEYSVLSLSWQGDFKINRLIANGEGLSCVQVASAIKDRLSVAEDLAVGIDHSLDYVSVDFSWALVWLDCDVIMVHVSAGHGDLIKQTCGECQSSAEA